MTWWTAENLGLVALGVLSLIFLIALTDRVKKMQIRGGSLSRMEAKLDLLLKHANIEFEPYKNVPSEIAEALRKGEKIEAIKLYRQSNRVGLREAKEAIEEMQRRAGV
jgi:ribosomal protein L7/L12